MSEIVVFDLKRVSTAIATTGKVHITQHGGAMTLCGIVLADGVLRQGHFRKGRQDWDENLREQQPQCIRCRQIAISRPVSFPFTKLVQPL